MIKIINYGMGNCSSIKNMLNYLNIVSEIANKPKDIEEAKAIILPGIGSYDNGIISLEPFRRILEKKCINEKVPFLGICLGMQLLLNKSEEGQLPGFGWISGVARRFDFSKLGGHHSYAVPHMGWNEVLPINESSLFNLRKKSPPERFYFAHSYHADQVPTQNKIAICQYNYEFTCAIQKENIYGVQFHPEKSHNFGKLFFQKFFTINKC